MELKAYQRAVIRNLERYMELLSEHRSSEQAYNAFWMEKNVPVGSGAVHRYQETIKGVPQLCFKVPTGGGKTFLACNAIRPIFDALPATKTKTVVWLVPSDAILEQTLKNLQDVSHPYRQKIDVDYQHNVMVYSKDELLNGTGFNPVAVTEQLSIMVLSYDSFRSKGKEGLKAYRENSNLVPFAKILGKPEQPIEKADETALFQVINQLHPLVIVDESHHATSALSLEMLRNFNPCFVLELTATPKRESNIISFVDAVKLKEADMVKLPVIVYNRTGIEDVLAEAIELRNRLEGMAEAEYREGGHYIRPIVLFQAQPKGKEDSTTFEKLRTQLESFGIPKEQIAIKTANINELKRVELESESCTIRYIITVNALKEGWDCPFAYILASLANRTSQVDVEQIVGRVLRLPHTRKNRQIWLNMSYVLTSSNDFNTTVQKIVKGLNSAGFSERDCRTGSLEQMRQPVFQPDTGVQIQVKEPEEIGTEDFLHFDPGVVKDYLEQLQAAPQTDEQPETAKTGIEKLLEESAAIGTEFEAAVEQNAERAGSDLSWEVRETMKTFAMKPQFVQEAQALRLPQFMYHTPEMPAFSMYGDTVRLEEETLNSGFTLKGKAYDIDFSMAEANMVRLDLEDGQDNTPRVFKMSKEERQYFQEYFEKLPEASRLKNAKGTIHNRLNRMNGVDAKELEEYINLIVRQMTKEQIELLEKHAETVARLIRERIIRLLREHRRKQFEKWMQTGRIVCEPYYRLPEEITPASSTTLYGKSLYQAEDGDINRLESKFILDLTEFSNVKWWHRNIARHGFALNGFINHYPDIIIMTQSGKIVLAETKGNDRDNSDTKQKIALGKAWESAAGRNYRYFMIFDDEEAPLEGAVTLSEFLEVLGDL